MADLSKLLGATPNEKFLGVLAELEELRQDYELPEEFETSLGVMQQLITSAINELDSAFKKRGASVAGLRRRVNYQRATIRGLETRLDELEALANHDHK